MKAKDADVQEAEIVTPYTAFREKLKEMFSGNPGTFEALKKKMAENGWNRSEDVPSDRYEDVYSWWQELLSQE